MPSRWKTPEEARAVRRQIAADIGKSHKKISSRTWEKLLEDDNRFVQLARDAAGEATSILPVEQEIQPATATTARICLHFRKVPGGNWRIRQSGFDGTVHVRLWSTAGPLHEKALTLRRDEQDLPMLAPEDIVEFEIEYEPSDETKT
jgi:hypothetical protein